MHIRGTLQRQSHFPYSALGVVFQGVLGYGKRATRRYTESNDSSSFQTVGINGCFVVRSRQCREESADAGCAVTEQSGRARPAV